MGNIYIWNYIPKAHIIVGTVDGHHAPGSIGKCDVAYHVWVEELCGITFVHCGEDNMANYCDIEGSGVNRMINAIG